MTSLAILVGTIVTFLQIHPICKNVRVVETKEFSSDQFFCKIRARLEKDAQLQIRIYYNRGHVDYTYQLFTDIPLLRWDNKEEFPYLASYPHHYHDLHGNVHPSSLQGDPLQDVPVVLQEVTMFLEHHKQ